MSGLERLAGRVHRFEDSCAAYVITSGQRALMIDLGSGEALDHLEGLGIGVDVVLHTHHHRDQCQGDLLVEPLTQIIVPAREAQYFEDAEQLWQTLGTSDLYDMTNHWQSLTRSVPVARRLEDYETVRWEGVEILALPTPGHTKGSLTYLADIDGLKWAFSGDLVHSPGRIWTLHDLQWSYLGHEGIVATLRSLRMLRQRAPDRLAPSHGPVSDDPEAVLVSAERNLAALFDVFAVGFSDVFDPPASPLRPQFEELSEHLVTVRSAVANFHVLHTGGRALFFDYGFSDWELMLDGEFRFVEHTLGELRERYGVQRVEVVVPTHYHDDHVCGIPFLQKKWDCEVWAHDIFAALLERPRDYRLPCLWPQPIDVTRRVADGEEIQWRGFRFRARHNPGHTHYAAVYLGVVDGLRVAICGDEFERDRNHRLRGAGPIYRNRVGIGSFPTGIATTREFSPELLLTGHIGASRVTDADFDHASRWTDALERSWRNLAALPDGVGFALDPDFISVHPYVTSASPGEEVTLTVEVRNHFGRDVLAILAPVPPRGWNVEPAEVDIEVRSHHSASATFTVVVPRSGGSGQRCAVPFDAIIGDQRFGQAGEGLVQLRS
jgi:glyoxylase-like metal-dependent hydrolase (beta-lactamase superfamily II)